MRGNRRALFIVVYREEEEQRGPESHRGFEGETEKADEQRTAMQERPEKAGKETGRLMRSLGGTVTWMEVRSGERLKAYGARDVGPPPGEEPSRKVRDETGFVK